MISDQQTRPIQRPAALPSCTVIVCTRQRPRKLERCLQSLRKLHYPSFTILVVENDAFSSEAEEIAIRHGALYRLCTRQGLSAARNFALRLSTSEIVAFVDDDAVAEPDWLFHSAPLFNDELVLAVTGRVAFHRSDLLLSAIEHEFDPGDQRVDQETPDWFGMSNFGGLGLGSNFLVRRSALERLGGFDERLGRGAPLRCSEENEFLFRVIDAGYAVATSSKAIVRHAVPKSLSSEQARRSVAASTVMASLLAVEHPEHLGRLLRYIWGALWRKPQPWRERSPHLFEDMGPRSSIYTALASGPLIYISATLRQFSKGTPVFAGALKTEIAPVPLTQKAWNRRVS